MSDMGMQAGSSQLVEAAGNTSRASMPEVTLVIPVYNAEKYLDACIGSVLAQTFSSYELILINDGSTDGSAAILDRYQRACPDKVRVVHQENAGVAIARNRGIDMARGQYIAFIDNDDTLLPDCISQFHACIVRTQADVVIGWHVQVEPDGRETIRTLEDKTWSAFRFLTPWARLYDISFLREKGIRFLDTKMGEEIYCSVKAAVNARKIAFLPYAGYRWHANPKSVSHTLQKGFQQAACPLKMLKALQSEIRQAEVGQEQYARYEYFNLKYCVWYLLDSGRHVGVRAMRREYDKVFGFIRESFPHWHRNSNLGMSRPDGEKATVRLLVYALMNLHRLGLDRLFYNLYAI